MVLDDELIVISSDDAVSDDNTDSNQSEDVVEDEVEHPQEVTFRGNVIQYLVANCSCCCFYIMLLLPSS